MGRRAGPERIFSGGFSLSIRAVLFFSLILCVASLAIPASADNLYNNGPINGQTDAWTINFGFVVSNQFTLCCKPGGGSTITGLSFGAWVFPGDVLESVEVSITSSEFGGTSFFDGVVNLTQSGCSSNSYGYDVCTESGSIPGVNLSDGSYWLNLQNAVVANGDPVYWDENSGGDPMNDPTPASENSVGTIPSESFTILGTNTPGGSVPEPGSILLLGSGLMAAVGMVRRRFMR
jgi:hypothetical protein